MKRSPLAAGVLSAAALLLACSAGAQDDRATMSDVWLVIPKAGSLVEFENAVKRHTAFRQDSGETRSWEVYSVALGPNPAIYQFRSGGMDWADFDAGIAEDAEKGLGDNWRANVDQYVDHYHHYIEVADYEYSEWPEDQGQKPYYGVTTWDVVGNAGPGPNAARQELSTISMENGWSETGGNWLWLTRIGGADKLMIVAGYDSFADMEEPEPDFFAFLTEHAGAEKAMGLFSTFGEGYTSANFTVWAHRPDLSTSAAGDSD